jgi:hypothetical protein
LTFGNEQIAGVQQWSAGKTTRQLRARREGRVRRVRQPPQFDPAVSAALDAARARLSAGDIRGALEAYQEGWDAAVAHGDHADASVVAHMAGVAEEDPRRKLEWNRDALREAPFEFRSGSVRLSVASAAVGEA